MTDSSTLESKDIIKLCLAILKNHYQREADKIEEILEAFQQLNAEKLESFWKTLLKRGYPEEEALQYLTQWIAASLDKGHIYLSKNEA